MSAIETLAFSFILSIVANGSIDGEEIRRAMRAHKATIRGIATKFDLELSRVRAVRANGLGTETFRTKSGLVLTAWEWAEMIVGERSDREEAKRFVELMHEAEQRIPDSVR